MPDSIDRFDKMANDNIAEAVAAERERIRLIVINNTKDHFWLGEFILSEIDGDIERRP
jgi:hypothetical protein